jgi:hypothetical protein
MQRKVSNTSRTAEGEETIIIITTQKHDVEVSIAGPNKT